MYLLRGSRNPSDVVIAIALRQYIQEMFAVNGTPAIASRYLGAERGRRYADVARRPPGVVVSLPAAGARTWDLHRTLP